MGQSLRLLKRLHGKRRTSSLADRQTLNNSATRSHTRTRLSKFLYQFLSFADANTATMTDARPPQRGGFELQPTDSQGVRPEFGSASGEGVDLENVYGSPEDFAVFTARSDERTFTDMRTGGPIYANQCPEENMYDPIEDSLVRLGY